MGAAVAKRSRTAQGVTAERAILSRMGVIDDEFASTMLAASWKPFVVMVLGWPTGTLAARFLWHDAQLRRSLDAGLRQVAVIGAGYDTRAWRFRHESVAFFELDHPATQRDKRRRAPLPGPTYVQADLNHDDAGAALARAGMDPTQAVHFIVEGVTMYLTEDVVRRQFAGLAAASGPGSRFSTDFYPPAKIGSSQDRRQLRAQRLARVGSGERLLLHLDRSQAAELIVGTGWDIEELTSLRDAAIELVPERLGLPLRSINEHKTVVAARASRA
jgi:methyltransferase (TIGR00027 family)